MTNLACAAKRSTQLLAQASFVSRYAIRCRLQMTHTKSLVVPDRLG